MRVIAGTAGGLRLQAPPGDAVRPTTDRARETLFSVLGDAVHDTRCLDLFAGTGALGIEALSRGAAHCTFVDRHPAALRALRDNLTRTRLQPQAAVIDATWQAALSRLARQQATFDIVFLDPPWDTDLAERCLQRLARSGRLAGDALVIVEHRRGDDPVAGGPWRVVRPVQVGESCFTLCRVQPVDGP